MTPFDPTNVTTTESSTHMINVDLPEDVRDLLDTVCADRNLSLSALIVGMIEHGRKLKLKPEKEERVPVTFRVPESYYEALLKDLKKTKFKNLRPWIRAMIRECAKDLK
jgi:hypothetical protein